ncbi:hypothetical protein B0H13DRAFT_2389539 [Mycena leptocephala]|nr:hypothetical protein B0H13DRAFT_2389539 [Mycena leptocephala]
MTSDADLLAYIGTLTDAEQRDYIARECTKHKPGLKKIRVMIVAKTCYTSEIEDLVSIFPDGSLPLFGDSASAQARSHSSFLKLAFIDKFYGYLDKGKVNGWNTEISRALSQTEDSN